MSNTYVPNTFQHPNVFVDRLLRLLTGNENKLLDIATRKIMGWEEKRVLRRDRISLSQFEELSNLNRKTIITCLERLSRANVLIPIGDWNGDGQMYELNLGQKGDYDFQYLELTLARAGNPNPSKSRTSRDATSGGSSGVIVTPPESPGDGSDCTGIGVTVTPIPVQPLHTQNSKPKIEIIDDSLTTILLPCGLSPIQVWEKVIERLRISLEGNRTIPKNGLFIALSEKVRPIRFENGVLVLEVVAHVGLRDWLRIVSPNGPTFDLHQVTHDPNIRVEYVMPELSHA